MTREEYLTALRNCIRALPLEEQTEALEYYLNYFQDADNDTKVMEELGSPEELAQTIKDKFACVPAEIVHESHKQENEADYKKRSSETNRTCIFSAEDVRSLDISIGTAEVVVIAGKDYSVETRGMIASDMRCSLSPYGTLCIDNERKIQLNSFFNHTKNWHPRILITVPDNVQLDSIKIHIGAGSLITKQVNLSALKASFDVGAGNLEINSFTGGKADVRCSMGNFKLKGSVTGLSRIDCAMGNVKFELNGNWEEYSYDAKVGIGDVRFNREKKSGICKTFASDCKNNHFSINCGMGSVNIDIR